MLLSANEVSRQQYYSRIFKKLIDSSTSPKFTFKTFLINRKIPCIPPLFNNNKFISNFRDEAELFNNFFARQCTLIDNASEIPATLQPKYFCQS